MQEKLNFLQIVLKNNDENLGTFQDFRVTEKTIYFSYIKNLKANKGNLQWIKESFSEKYNTKQFYNNLRWRSYSKNQNTLKILTNHIKNIRLNWQKLNLAKFVCAIFKVYPVTNNSDSWRLLGVLIYNSRYFWLIIHYDDNLVENRPYIFPIGSIHLAGGAGPCSEMFCNWKTQILRTIAPFEIQSTLKI